MKYTKTIARWQLLLGSLGILATMLACAAIGVGSDSVASTPASEEIALQFDNGVIEVRGETGDWAPVAGVSSFDLTAELESLDPWRVSGTDITANESTEIEANLQAGDPVRVRGFILDDGAWLAHSIERADEQVDPIITLIGRADSVDPWVVNGIQLNVTGETEVQGVISPGTFVSVEILLLPDGTWEALSIVPLGNFDGEAECETVVARVTSVDGNVIQLEGWPAITLDEDIEIVNEADGEDRLDPNQKVLVVVCPSGESQVIIVRIIVLNNLEDGTAEEGGEKVLICHKPEKKGGHTISISSSAVPAHLAHGDTEGPCP
jgi:hypothetical protein